MPRAWHEHEQILKLEIPTVLASPRVFAKVPGDVLERSANGEEEPYQDWIAVQGKLSNAEYSLDLVNNSTYSYDCLNGLFRTILIRSAPFARHNPNPVPYNDDNAWQDQGRQERKFWLMCGRGSYKDLALDRRAEDLQIPAEYVMDSAHPGSQPWEQSSLMSCLTTCGCSPLNKRRRDLIARVNPRRQEPSYESRSVLEPERKPPSKVRCSASARLLTSLRGN